VPPSSLALPHRFPFRLADRREGEGVTLALSVDAVWGQGDVPYPPSLIVEMLAQAAMVLLENPDGSTKAFLAGVEDLVVLHPPESGQRLCATATLQARFGGTIKILGRLEADGKVLATASLLLVAAP
jgi:3-hydroxymyristoyl/3-hydroxydecanoyl-(acyl carrier protein) dehydratase